MTSNPKQDKNFISRIFSIFNWDVQCQCCGERDQANNFDQNNAVEGTQQPENGRSTATSERSKQFMQGVHKLDEDYLKTLLEGFGSCGNCPTGPIRKKKDQKKTTPKWNQQLETMFKQSVAMYGCNINLLHAFFPGFGKDFLDRRIKKLQRASKKKQWTDEEDQKLANSLVKTGGNFQAVAPQFLGVTLETLKERTEILKNKGFFNQYMQQQQRNQTKKLSSIAEMSQEGGMATESNNANQQNLDMSLNNESQRKHNFDSATNMGSFTNLGIDKNSGFNFTFDPDLDMGTPRNMELFRHSNNEIGQDKPIAFSGGSSIFEHPKQGGGFSSFNDAYDQQISQIFGSGIQEEGGMQEETNNQNQGFNAFLDLNNSDAFGGNDSQAGSPCTNMRIRPMDQMDNNSFSQKML